MNGFTRIMLNKVRRDYGFCEDFKQLEPIEDKGDAFSGFAGQKEGLVPETTLQLFQCELLSHSIALRRGSFRANDFLRNFQM